MDALRLRDVSGLGTLLPLDNLELDVIAFGKRLEATSLNGAEVDKDIRPTLSRDEAVAFGVIEPLHRTLETCHEPYLFELCSDPRSSRWCVHSQLKGRVHCHRDRLGDGTEGARGKFYARR